MSEASPGDRNWKLNIQEMIEFAQRVLAYTDRMDQESFLADTRTYDAALRNIELIGEASSHVPQDIRDAHPQIEWRRIIATRNQVAHGYMGIDSDILWDIIHNDLPDLLPKLHRMLELS